jgi:hypothetical protein
MGYMSGKLLLKLDAINFMLVGAPASRHMPLHTRAAPCYALLHVRRAFWSATSHYFAPKQSCPPCHC